MIKTQASDASVADFIGKQPEAVRADCAALIAMMEKATGEAGKLWGSSIVGFGSYRYQYKSGRDGEWFRVGFSPRKANIVVYLMPSAESYPDHLARLGKYKTGVSCLYIKRLSEVDANVLEEMIRESVRWTHLEEGSK